MILCCGEALIDMLPRETAEGAPAFVPHPGGAAFNTAIALGRLGAPAGWFGGLSRDYFGRMIEASMDAADVNHLLSARSDRPTTLAFVMLTDGQARYAFHDENSAGRMIRRADLPVLDGETEALLFGGISLVADPAGETLAALCRRAGDRAVMLDPNIRPGFVTDEAAYRTRLTGMLSRADLVKVSDEDMDWLRLSPEDLLGLGASLVLVTRGAEGVEAVSDKGRRTLPAEPVTVVDAVGAGDTFNAGLLAGLHRDDLLTREALRHAPLSMLEPAIALGVQAAAVTVSRAGANPPWAHEL